VISQIWVGCLSSIELPPKGFGGTRLVRVGTTNYFIDFGNVQKYYFMTYLQDFPLDRLIY